MTICGSGCRQQEAEQLPGSQQGPLPIHNTPLSDKLMNGQQGVVDDDLQARLMLRREEELRISAEVVKWRRSVTARPMNAGGATTRRQRRSDSSRWQQDCVEEKYDLVPVEDRWIALERGARLIKRQWAQLRSVGPELSGWPAYP